MLDKQLLRRNTGPNATSAGTSSAPAFRAASLWARVHVLVLVFVGSIALLVARVRVGLSAEEHLTKELVGVVLLDLFATDSRRPRRPAPSSSPSSTPSCSRPLFILFVSTLVTGRSFSGSRRSARCRSRRLAVTRLSLSRAL